MRHITGDARSLKDSGRRRFSLHNFIEDNMSDYDRNPSARWGQGAARIGRAEIDQGLRSYMLGVYNNMVVGLALTGAVALGVHLLAVTTDPALGVPAGRHLL